MFFKPSIPVTNPQNGVYVADGSAFSTIQAAINGLGVNPGLVFVPSTYTGAQPTSVPTNISIQTLEVPGWTVIYGNLTGVSPAQESGKFIVWTPGFGGGAVNPTASALPYTASQIQNQFAVNLVSQGPLKIPVGAYINTQVNGDTTLGQSPKDINAVFGNIITGGLTAIGASDSAVSGEFAVSVNQAGTPTLPLAVGVFGRINQTAAQPISIARGIQGAVSTTAGTITNAYSVYGVAPVSSGTGAITNAFSGYFTIPSIGTSVNRAFHAEGDSSIGGTVTAPAIRLSRSATGTINLLGGTVDPSGVAGDVFYRTDLSRFRYFDTAWHSLARTDSETLTSPVIDTSTFAALGTPANGTLKYCSDCTIANPCAGGGTGALAKRINATWICN